MTLHLFLAGSLTACLFEDCGTCEKVTVEADGTVTRGQSMLLCGDELADKQNSAPQIIDGKTVYWECY